MRFLADMGVSPASVATLCALGHDAIHLRDEGLHRLSDQLVLEKARVEQRILLTNDLDFGYLVAISGEVLPSVVLFRLSDMRPANIETRLISILETFSAELSNGAFVVVTDSGYRVRRLPIGSE